jgi:hypothetical protein
MGLTVVQKLAQEEADLWNYYKDVIEENAIVRSAWNLTRYGVLWGRKKDGAKYLSKIKALFKDPKYLDVALNNFREIMDNVIP